MSGLCLLWFGSEAEEEEEEGWAGFERTKKKKNLWTASIIGEGQTAGRCDNHHYYVCASNVG